MTDPMTDKGAAEAFTAKHGHRPQSLAGTPQGQRLRVAPDHWDNAGKPVCQGSTEDRGWGFYRTHQCLKTGKTTLADGSTWCGIHSPDGVAKREAARTKRNADRSAKWDAEKAAWKAERDRNAAFPLFLAALREIADGANDARAVAREALASYDP